MTALRHAQRGMRIALRAWRHVEGCVRRAEPCAVCGRRAALKFRPIISDELAAAWELTPQWRAFFDEREGLHCPLCGSSLRSRRLARAICEWFYKRSGERADSLAKLVANPSFRKLDIAELNACGTLHPWLARHPRLAYSEYGARPPVRSEDLMGLTYADASFDLALTSETLEHVPDVHRALAEIRRILKPGGAHIFTAPVVWDRPATRRCAEITTTGAVSHLRPPSYHGCPGTTASDMLVFYEFGSDVVGEIEKAGFRVRLIQDTANPAVAAFITEKRT